MVSIERIPLSREELVVVCHNGNMADVTGATVGETDSSPHHSIGGTCHSPANSAKGFLTRTRVGDGSVVPLVWACHNGYDDGSGIDKRVCHVVEKAIVAFTRAHRGTVGGLTEVASDSTLAQSFS